jgi:hypothetical protein
VISAEILQAQLSYFPHYSVHGEDEILQAERGTPQLSEIPPANYRTAPEITKRKGVKNPKRNGNYRTAKKQHARSELKKPKHNYRT